MHDDHASARFCVVVSCFCRLHRPRRRARRGRAGAQPGTRRPVVHAAPGALEARFDAQAHFVRYRAFDSGQRADHPRACRLRSSSARRLQVSDGTRRARRGADHRKANGADRRSGAARRRAPRSARAVDRPPSAASLSRAGAVRVRRRLRRRRAARSRCSSGSPTRSRAKAARKSGPFAATVTAPRAFPALSRWGRCRARAGDSDFDVRWADGGDGGAAPARGEVVLARRRAYGALPRARRRRLHPAARRLRRAARAGDVSSATLTATRLSRSALFAPGAGSGELTLALKDVAALQVAP